MFILFLNVQYTPSDPFQFTYKFYVQSKYLYFDKKKYQHSTTPNQYCQIHTYSQVCTRDGFQFVFNHVNVLVLAHALPTRISPRIASPIVTFLKLPIQQYQWSTDNICTRVCSAHSCTPSFHLYRSYVEERDVKK